MPNKPISDACNSARAKRTRATAPANKVRLPQSWRTVTTRKLRPLRGDRGRAKQTEVPEIRLSGVWLGVVGFRPGRRYLISVDRGIETIYLQAEPEKTRFRS